MSDKSRPRQSKFALLSLAIYASLALFSVAGVAIGEYFHLHIAKEAKIFGPLTLIAGVIAIYAQISWNEKHERLQIWKSFLVAGAFGGLAELCGVILGVPFGRYRYTGLWFPTVTIGIYGYYPLLIPLAWILVPGSWALFAGARFRFGPAVLIAATLSTLTDFIMEPVLVHVLRYWVWIRPGPLPGGAPFLNPFGWWVCSAVVAVIFLRSRLVTRQIVIAVPLIYLAMILAIGTIIR